jgi:hypothetical protein
MIPYRCIGHGSTRFTRLLLVRFTAECMLVMTSILHLGMSSLPEKKMTKDDADRLNLCLKVPYIITWYQVIFTRGGTVRFFPFLFFLIQSI